MAGSIRGTSGSASLGSGDMEAEVNPAGRKKGLMLWSSQEEVGLDRCVMLSGTGQDH